MASRLMGIAGNMRSASEGPKSINRDEQKDKIERDDEVVVDEKT